MPFLVTPEGKVLAQSGAIMKYIWKKAGIKTNIGSGALKGQKGLDVYSVQFFCWFQLNTSLLQLVPFRVKS